MTGKKNFRTLERRLVDLGFTYSHSNARDWFIYTHPEHPDLCVNPGVDDNAARQIVRKVERALGAAAKAPKRDARAAKERQAAEREQLREEAERLERARQEFVHRRDSLLDDHGSHLTGAEIRDLERRVEEIDRRQREIEALMTERPCSGRDRAKHRSGAR